MTREYYLNDEGNQMNMLGASIRVRYWRLCGIEEPFPEDGYKGSYVSISRKLSKKIRRTRQGRDGIGDLQGVRPRWMMEDIRKDLNDFGVKFDVWYSQTSSASPARSRRRSMTLREKGHIYEKEGATWFRSTSFGDDKDRVVINRDGSLTYLTPDIAYHLEKYRRGFKRLIDIWGPDHHGYVPRMKAAIKALGYQAESLSVLIVQLATLYRDGQQVRCRRAPASS